MKYLFLKNTVGSLKNMYVFTAKTKISSHFSTCTDLQPTSSRGIWKATESTSLAVVKGLTTPLDRSCGANQEPMGSMLSTSSFIKVVHLELMFYVN